MALRGPILVSRDGSIYIVKEYASSEPGEIRAFYWPVGMKTHSFVQNYLHEDIFPSEGILARDSGDGVYEVDLGGVRPLRVRLREGGSTQAEFIDTRTVDPPKIRGSAELRWDDVYGRWLKASKSTKWQWVPAESRKKKHNPTEPVTESELTKRLKF